MSEGILKMNKDHDCEFCHGESIGWYKWPGIGYLCDECGDSFWQGFTLLEEASRSAGKLRQSDREHGQSKTKVSVQCDPPNTGASLSSRTDLRKLDKLDLQDLEPVQGLSLLFRYGRGVLCEGGSLQFSLSSVNNKSTNAEGNGK